MSEHRWSIITVLALALLFPSPSLRAADRLVHEELRIPMDAAGPRGLEALLVRPEGHGRFPLVLINHGSPRSGADRPGMLPTSLLPQAREFARRGWAAVIVMRRGYGGSGGGWAEDYSGCRNPDYVRAAAAAVADLKTAASVLAVRPDIDVTRMIAVGVSAGGFATVALTADPPPGLAAAINFAGGRGSLKADEVCGGDKLVDAFRSFGTRSRTPMLWVYSENDHFFGPELADRFKSTFTAGGGRVEFIRAPAFGDDGHHLFSAAGIPQWTPYVDDFLKRRGLVPRGAPAAAPVARPQTVVLTPPSVLGREGRKAFESYLAAPPHKAFAVSRDGYFGWRSGRRTVEEAREAAREYCEENTDTCSVVFVDDAPTRR